MSNRLRTADSARQYTMDDLAAELGLSKSTVSRALSGSGRIGAQTVRRVKDCAEKHGFKPNLAAKALAGQRSLNLAAVMPEEATASQVLFYHDCLSGMVSAAAEAGYSILVCMSAARGTAALEDVIANRKADAAILTQLRHEDENVALLSERGFPFVVIGSCDLAGISPSALVDSKMSESCADFTRLCVRRLLSSRTVRRANVLFVCGSLDVEANNKRLSGFLTAMEDDDAKPLQYAVCTDAADITEVTAGYQLGDWGLILCADDVVCVAVQGALRRQGAAIGREVLLASLHDSVLLEQSVPAVSALRVDARTLGSTAAETALKMLSGAEFAQASYVDCSFQLRASTGSVDSSVTANDNDSRRRA